MTDQLFHAPPAVTAAPPLRPPERYGRWVLHRAGIVNVWQYDRAEISFAGGRALLRGKNGAGKSKALEVLLPFLLDGDTRSIDAAGRDRTSVYWLMSDGREPGNYVGYVWLEMRLSDEEGGDSFLTLGAGLKAATSTRAHSSWFFIAEGSRVGTDFELGPEVSAERLREVLGSDAVTTATEHRRRVALRLFGLHDEGRYSNLLRLLHRLRDPNIGNRIEAGELAMILSDALPPPSDQALEMAAERFDTLDQVREQLARTQKTSAALSRFLDTYRGYARSVLRDRAQSVISADDHRRSCQRQLKQVTDGSRRAAEQMTAARDAVAQLRETERASVRELEGLRGSDAYKEHLNLVDRRRLVGSLADAAAQAEGHSEQLASLADQAASDALRASEEAGAATRAARARRGALVPLAEAAGAHQSVLPIDDPEAIPAAVSVIAGRRRAAEQVRELARAAQKARAVASAADEQVARSEGELQHRRGEAESSREAWVAASQEWRRRVSEWAGATLPLPDGPRLGSDLLDAVLRHGTAEAEELSSARSAGLAMLRPAQEAARAVEAAAAAAVVEAQRALDEKEAERRGLEATEEARPARSRFQVAERDPNGGAPFYELVEVAGSLAPEDRAGLEAALEASGLLDAWVAEDGLVMHPTTSDVLVRPDAPVVPAGVPTLADVLVPVRPSLTRLLGAVAWGDPGRGAAHPWVTADGRWSFGPLQGAWSKECSEYLGAGARRETRLRRLAELTRQCEDMAAALTALESRLTRSRDAAAAIDAHAGAFPGDRDVAGAASDCAARQRVQAEAASRHDADRRLAEQARTVAARAGAELAHAAASDSLPELVDALGDVIEAARRLEHELGAWRQQWQHAADRQAEASRFADRAASQREAAVSATAAAQAARHRHQDEAGALAALEEGIGSTVAEVLAAIQDWSRRGDEARAAQPAAEEAEREAAIRQGQVREALVTAEERLSQSVRAVEETARRLCRALDLPGVAAAAGASAADPSAADSADAADSVDLAMRTREQVGTGEHVSDQVVLNRLHDLEDGLAGGYDVVTSEEDGVKFFHVVDDTGRQPLPSVAERVAAEAAAAARRLDASEQEVIRKFLLGELGEELRERLLEAHDLVSSANQALSGQRTSHGIGARLDWKIDPEAPAVARTAAEMLVRQPRSGGEEAQLRDALMEMIRSQRERDPALGYLDHLREALDYRRWHRFTVQVVDDAKPGTRRALHSRLGLSQGEQRVVSYLALFAAAAAYYEGIGPACPRLLLLDDAFAKVDEPTHGRLLELLVQINLDFLITSERMWGCFKEVPSLEIYEALREPSVPGVALVHFRWDGEQRHLVGL
ncbi:MAG: TIGR02680 family protein [Acidimicrobiales bacterium]